MKSFIQNNQILSIMITVIVLYVFFLWMRRLYRQKPTIQPQELETNPAPGSDTQTIQSRIIYNRPRQRVMPVQILPFPNNSTDMPITPNGL